MSDRDLALTLMGNYGGNIDLTRRPHMANPDGSVSTLRSMSFGDDSGEVLIPTVREDGWYMSPDQAISHYRQTGKRLGVFPSPDQATEYAKILSRFMK